MFGLTPPVKHPWDSLLNWYTVTIQNSWELAIVIFVELWFDFVVRMENQCLKCSHVHTRVVKENSLKFSSEEQGTPTLKLCTAQCSAILVWTPQNICKDDSSSLRKQKDRWKVDRHLHVKPSSTHRILLWVIPTTLSLKQLQWRTFFFLLTKYNTVNMWTVVAGGGR